MPISPGYGDLGKIACADRTRENSRVLYWSFKTMHFYRSAGEAIKSICSIYRSCVGASERAKRQASAIAQADEQLAANPNASTPPGW